MDQITSPDFLGDAAKKEEIKTALKNFNDKYCSQPIKKEFTTAKSKLELLFSNLKMHLTENFMQVRNIEYTGSSYEGLKLSGDGLEFDAMFIFAGGENLQILPIEEEEGFANLKILDTDDAKTSLGKYIDKETNVISSFTMKNKFKGALQDFQKKYKDFISMKEHGPAIQFDYEERDVKFSVDLLLSFEVQVQGEDSKFLNHFIKCSIFLLHLLILIR